MDIISTIPNYAWVLTLFFGLIGLYHYNKNRRIFQITYEKHRTIELFSDSSGPFQLIHNMDYSRPYCQMFLTRISITNTGNQEFKKQEISADDPIRIAWSKSEVIDVSAHAITKNLPSLKVIKKSPVIIELSFQYFNPKEAFNILLYHLEEDIEIEVSGKAVNLDRIISKSELNRNETKKMLIIYSIIWIAALGYIVNSIVEFAKFDKFLIPEATLIIGFIFTLMSSEVLSLWRRLKKRS